MAPAIDQFIDHMRHDYDQAVARLAQVGPSQSPEVVELLRRVADNLEAKHSFEEFLSEVGGGISPREPS